MKSNYEVIKEAIEGKLQVVVEYDGQVRELCPHAIGAKNGRSQALFYQFGGGSKSRAIIPGSPQNWRCLPVNGLKIISVQPGEWHTASNHSRPSTCIDVIDTKVDL